MNFRRIVQVLSAEGFVKTRQKGSHRTYEGVVDGIRRVVTIAYHTESEDVRPATLQSIIRQSGLPRSKFR